LLAFSPDALPLSLSDLCEKDDAAAAERHPTLPTEARLVCLHGYWILWVREHGCRPCAGLDWELEPDAVL
jgi:hypothetical protein